LLAIVKKIKKSITSEIYYKMNEKKIEKKKSINITVQKQKAKIFL